GVPSGGHHFPPLSGPEQATDFLSLTPPPNTAANCTAQTRWNWLAGMNAGKILGAGSQGTLRWREMDSNHRSLSRASRFILREVNCAGIDGAAKKTWRGTDGSNPSPSSAESFQVCSRPVQCSGSPGLSAGGALI